MSEKGNDLLDQRQIKNEETGHFLVSLLRKIRRRSAKTNALRVLAQVSISYPGTSLPKLQKRVT